MLCPLAASTSTAKVELVEAGVLVDSAHGSGTGPFRTGIDYTTSLLAPR
jgi:hypothetical protein